MTEHIPTISVVIALSNFALTWGLGFYVHVISKSKAANNRIAKLEADTVTAFGEHGDRLARLEERLEHVPTHDDLGKIHDKLNAVANSTARIAGELRHISDVQKMILEKMSGGRDG